MNNRKIIVISLIYHLALMNPVKIDTKKSHIKKAVSIIKISMFCFADIIKYEK